MKSEETAFPFPHSNYRAVKNRKGIPRHLINNEYMSAIWGFTITVL